MGATTEGAPNNGSTGLDPIRRYRTTCKVRIDSHRFTEPMFISDDVVAIQLGKTIKGPGQANLTLVAHRNWLNYIAPNDLINIYFDIGDGDGWTRTFFGFVDRIEESYTVGDNGTPKTTYTLTCTDFFKAFSKTQIYFNPHLAGRSDLDGGFFGTPNIGGLALQTQGVRVFGAPSDIVINLVLLLLGFGTQFTLPESYPANLASKLRQQRAEFVTERLTLSNFAREAISSGGFQQLQEELSVLSSGAARDVANAGDSQEDRIRQLSQESGISEAELISANAEGGHSALTRLLQENALNREITLTDPHRAGEHDTAALNILNSTLDNAPPSLLDVVDPITYVERRAMDGYHAAASVWQRQGTLISIVRALSHEIMNELVFDLRPVTALNTIDGVVGNELRDLPYSRGPDEVEGNISDNGENDGIQYIPAMMMREYPFSTVDGLALNNSEILGGSRTTGGPDRFFMWFGDIWQDEPNKPGRHIVEIPNINVADQRDGNSDLPGIKHLDVAVISETEIVSSQLGRSDNEHFNLMEFWVDGLLGNDQRFYMHDLLPIITPIHIMRHGLRVRSLTTRFARFSTHTASIASTQPPEEEQDVVDESEEETPSPPPSAALIAPISQADNPGTRSNGNNNVVFNNSQAVGAFARHGYRRKANIGPAGAWVMHNGIDIVAEGGLEVKAIADGEIVASVPAGFPSSRDLPGFSRYGNIVVIRHTDIPNAPSNPFYSVYAHLRTITPEGGWGAGRTSPSGGQRAYTAAGWNGRTRGQAPLRVTQGTVIGTIGNTGCTAATRGPNGNTHLHFEIDRHFPPRNDSITPRLPFVTPPADFRGTVFIRDGTVTGSTVTGATEITRAQYRSASNAERRDQNLRVASFWDGQYHIGSQRTQAFGGVVPTTGPKPATPSGSQSFDPVAVYTSLDLDLVELINDGTPAVDTSAETEEDDDDRGLPPPEDPEEQDRTEEEASEELPPLRSSRGVVVDSALVRKQVVRWALLNDLWYQHNLEYLNGRIDMRGAPEIRVGYRLDVTERNMSFYVEGVNHSWSFPGRMSTSLSVTRGQPNNPYPLYVLPPLDVYGATEVQRKLSTSRLAHSFIVPDPLAVRRGVVLRQSGGQNAAFQVDPLEKVLGDGTGNYLDAPEQVASFFDECIIVPGSTAVRHSSNTQDMMEDEDALFTRDALQNLGSLEDQDNPSGVTGTNIDNQLTGDSISDAELALLEGT